MEPQNIKALRVKLKMTQKELANKIGVDQVTVCRWENGRTKPIPIARKQLEKLAATAK